MGSIPLGSVQRTQKMTRSKLIATLGLAATMATTAIVPTIANASVQSDKNNMRNLAIAGAAVAGYGLLNHNTGATVLGLAGAVLAGSQYQKDQNIENSWHDRWGWDGGRDNRDYHRDYDRNYNQGYNRDYNYRGDYHADRDNRDYGRDHNGR